MGDLGLDKPPIRAHDARHADIPVEDADVTALPDQGFDQSNDWTFAQVIGAGLECQAHNADATLLRPQHRLNGRANLAFI